MIRERNDRIAVIDRIRECFLAVHGGPPVRRELFRERGHIGAEEKAAIDALFDRATASGITPGYDGEEETAYCEELAAYLGGGYVDAVSSGTPASTRRSRC